MRSKYVAINALDVSRNFSITVDVSIKNLWRLRVGAWLLGLAAKVLCCEIRFNNSPERT